jgi:hypothetical protein
VTPGAYVRPSLTARLLGAAVTRRRTNRRPFADVPVAPEIQAELVQAAEAEGCRLVLVDDAERSAVLGIIRAAEAHLGGDPRYQEETGELDPMWRGRADGVPPSRSGRGPRPTP